MTKFVAALFLPFVIGVVTLTFRETRRQFAREWRGWLAAAVLAVVLIVPWFAYMQHRVGSALWTTMLTAHVYTRFTSYLDPAHVKPWGYYFASMYDRFSHNQSIVVLLCGLAVLTLETVRRRWFEGATVLLWFALPVFLISFGTSKLYHYSYPFLPPLTLAAGYAVAVALKWAPAAINRVLQPERERLQRGQLADFLRRPALRLAFAVIAAVAAWLAFASVLHGEVRVSVGNTTLIRNSTFIRPMLIAALCGILIAQPRNIGRAVTVTMLALFLPLTAYFDALSHLNDQNHPIRSARDCVVGVSGPQNSRGLYVYVPDQHLPHAVYYYFRRVRPWSRATTLDSAAIERAIDDPTALQPALVWDARAAGDVVSRVPSVQFDDISLMLPGPYAVCATSSHSTVAVNQ